MSLIVKVKPKHVRKGVPLSYCQCPIALAVAEMPNVQNVIVQTKTLAFYDTLLLKMRHFHLSPEAMRFVKHFDHNLSVGTITLELEEIK